MRRRLTNGPAQSRSSPSAPLSCERKLSATVHNPDQHMSALRTLIAQGRKRIGLLIGAGGPAGMKNDAGDQLIPAVAGLTNLVMDALKPAHGAILAALWSELDRQDIEALLSRVRTLASVLGPSTQAHGLDAAGYAALGDAICAEIASVVKVDLPTGPNAYGDIVNWIVGASRDHAVEIFTTNYDLLLEEALERAKAPYFDGFTGAREAFFDPVSVAASDLPPRWTRLWKIHGSLGWSANPDGDIVRVGDRGASQLVFPAHLKYDQTQKAPYSAMLDRLRAFLGTPDTLLITTGFSFADAHISARIEESLAGNPSASLFAFQFQPLTSEAYATAIATRRPNFSVYARDAAVV